MSRLSGQLVGLGLGIAMVANPYLLVAQSNSLQDVSNVGTKSVSEEDAKLIAELPENPRANSSQNNAGTSSSQAVSQGSTQTQNGSATTLQQPTGTAAAPPVTTSGNAASRPAGAAIAPPKQRQVHSLLIKVGLLAGAGVALGTVAALSAASPSRVPGSH
jgi:cytoskeletal protein RodZ